MEQEQKAAGQKNQNIILENREKMSVSGVEEVIHFDENAILLRTLSGELSIRGEGLKVESLQVKNGDLLVSGRISALYYAEESVGWWERLFG